MLFSSCEKEESKENYEYESPVATFFSAFNRADEESLLNCFTIGAKNSFSDGDEEAVSMLSESIKASVGEKARLKFEITGKTALNDEEIKQLQDDYQSKYSLRIEIKKAYKLSVTVTTLSIGTTGHYSQNLELTTIKVGGSWLIYGDVITQLKLISEEE